MEENTNDNKIDFKKKLIFDKDFVKNNSIKKRKSVKKNESTRINVEHKMSDDSSTPMEKKQSVEKSTKNKVPEVKAIALDKLVSFAHHPFQTYAGERLEQLMNSIKRLGLMNSIIVRPVDDGKYEIICGHSRVAAMKALGRDVIQADIRTGLTDDEAIGLYYDSNLNQQSFSDWSYSQKLDAIKYSEKLIKENSQQVERTDIEKKADEKSKRSTPRDKMARRLGIATATLNKHRSIIKLPDDIIDILARLLDEKKLSFEIVYRISKLKPDEIRSLLEYIQKNSFAKPDVVKIKLLIEKSKSLETVLTKEEMQKIILSDNS